MLKPSLETYKFFIDTVKGGMYKRKEENHFLIIKRNDCQKQSINIWLSRWLGTWSWLGRLWYGMVLRRTYFARISSVLCFTSFQHIDRIGFLPSKYYWKSIQLQKRKLCYCMFNDLCFTFFPQTLTSFFIFILSFFVVEFSHFISRLIHSRLKCFIFQFALNHGNALLLLLVWKLFVITLLISGGMNLSIWFWAHNKDKETKNENSIIVIIIIAPND